MAAKGKNCIFSVGPIYVGYRYFDTFRVKPAYEFGFGRSYTSFHIAVEQVQVTPELISLLVQVTNTGARPGREVVQVYACAPWGELKKPAQQLVCFGKTGVLQPGCGQHLQLRFHPEMLASYCESRAAWILEAGDYILQAGNSSRNNKPVAVLQLDKTVVLRQLKNRLQPKTDFQKLSPKEVCIQQPVPQGCPRIRLEAAVFTGKGEAGNAGDTEFPCMETAESITASDVLSGYRTLEELVGQLTTEQLVEICLGTSRRIGNVIGQESDRVPGAAGETSHCARMERDIRSIVLADGPAGLRLVPHFYVDQDGKVSWEDINPFLPAQDTFSPPDGATEYWQYTTAIPTGTQLAQTWDEQALFEAGRIVAEEMQQFHVQLWLAPGMNIHRNPLCGRNFEYFSEDPVLSGLCAAAEVRGVQSVPGLGATVKHFACNNQESNRMATNAIVGERALREIYLRGFELVVRMAQPMSVMSSYNLLNGIHTANHKDLLTGVLREEWDFRGFVMSDWYTTVEMGHLGTGKYEPTSVSQCIIAGNDLTMPGSNEDYDELIACVGDAVPSKGTRISKVDLQHCVKRILQALLQCACYESCAPYRTGTLEQLSGCRVVK